MAQELQDQRDELLAALRDVIGWVPAGKSAWHTDAPIESVKRARAAIARCQESTKVME